MSVTRMAKHIPKQASWFPLNGVPWKTEYRTTDVVLDSLRKKCISLMQRVGREVDTTLKSVHMSVTQHRKGWINSR